MFEITSFISIKFLVKYLLIHNGTVTEKHRFEVCHKQGCDSWMVNGSIQSKFCSFFCLILKYCCLSGIGVYWIVASTEVCDEILEDNPCLFRSLEFVFAVESQGLKLDPKKFCVWPLCMPPTAQLLAHDNRPVGFVTNVVSVPEGQLDLHIWPLSWTELLSIHV